MHRQPNTTVREVLEDVYELRNIVAHGQEIPKDPYRQPHTLMSTIGQPINQTKYSYAELLLDTSLFMLTTALRRIFTEELYDSVANTKQWRAKLTSYEHRYKKAGGTEKTKARRG